MEKVSFRHDLFQVQFLGRDNLDPSHFIARNLNLKIGFFRRKTAVIGQQLGLIQQKFQELLVL
jgi:hypothetical protein